MVDSGGTWTNVGQTNVGQDKRGTDKCGTSLEPIKPGGQAWGTDPCHCGVALGVQSSEIGTLNRKFIEIHKH